MHNDGIRNEVAFWICKFHLKLHPSDSYNRAAICLAQLRTTTPLLSSRNGKLIDTNLYIGVHNNNKRGRKIDDNFYVKLSNWCYWVRLTIEPLDACVKVNWFDSAMERNPYENDVESNSPSNILGDPVSRTFCGLAATPKVLYIIYICTSVFSM